MKVDLRLKIVMVGFGGFVTLAILLNVMDFRNAKKQAHELYVEKARSVVLAAESAREEMAKKWDLGLFSSDKLREWADQGHQDKILAAVPVVTAWETSMAKAREGNYTFKVPKFEPRNPDNRPDPLEADALRRFENEGVEEYVTFDKELNSIRYFHPIKLTKECLLCHGDPKNSQELWGNSEGLDPTGSRMENWKVGEVHGAFEVVQSLDEVDAMLKANLMKKILGTLIMLALGSGIFYWTVTRTVVKPVEIVIDALSANSSEVSGASIHVAESSTRMAEGATTQAGNLQEISTTLQQLTELTNQNSRLAHDVTTQTQEAVKAADAGQTTMERMGQAIQRIKESSDQTTGIIKTIDEIAFQTNLLALNAAVEAARAGDAGKGFAVVAEEVRNLAQRSAEAARNTNVLLEESASHANQGVVVANEVSAILMQISAKVQEVGDLAEEVNHSSSSQAVQISQISEAVTEVDGVTQGNAASAEESAAASEELSAQATILQGLVESLKAVVEGGESEAEKELVREAWKGNGAGSAAARRSYAAGKSQVHHFSEEEEDTFIEV
jgi:methyl-accepting chemotaxis protein